MLHKLQAAQRIESVIPGAEPTQSFVGPIVNLIRTVPGIAWKGSIASTLTPAYPYRRHKRAPLNRNCYLTAAHLKMHRNTWTLHFHIPVKKYLFADVLNIANRRCIARACVPS